MQWLAKNTFSFNKRKGRNKSTESPHPSPVDDEDAENSKLQQQFSNFSATEDDDRECGEHSIEETLVRIPGEAVVNLVEAGEDVSDSAQLGSGEFSIVRLVQGNTGIALLVNVGEDVRWPLTKDEPTLKLDSRHYLFSIRPPPDEEAADKDMLEILNYGVTFADGEGLDLLDSFLQQHACLSLPAESTGSASKSTRSAKGSSCERENPEAAYWTALAPRVEDYNSVVAKAIASGSGQIIKGLFLCTNAYASQVQKGGESVRSPVTKAESKKAAAADHQKRTSTPAKISPRTKRNIRRAKKLSRMTEKLSENMLAGVVTVGGAVTVPVVGSKAGQKFFRMLPGDVLLASLDAFNKVLEAAEVVGRDALSAASEATVEIVANRLGEEAVLESNSNRCALSNAQFSIAEICQFTANRKPPVSPLQLCACVVFLGCPASNRHVPWADFNTAHPPAVKSRHLTPSDIDKRRPIWLKEINGYGNQESSDIFVCGPKPPNLRPFVDVELRGAGLWMSHVKNLITVMKLVENGSDHYGF